MPLPLNINSVYTFDTHAPALLGATIKNARLLSSLSFEMAMKFKNVEVEYKAIFPELPNGSPESPINEIFHLFRSESGEQIIVAEPWIVSASLVAVTNINFTIQVVNATSQDKAAARAALAHLGLDFTIS